MYVCVLLSIFFFFFNAPILSFCWYLQAFITVFRLGLFLYYTFVNYNSPVSFDMNVFITCKVWSILVEIIVSNLFVVLFCFFSIRFLPDFVIGCKLQLRNSSILDSFDLLCLQLFIKCIALASEISVWFCLLIVLLADLSEFGKSEFSTHSKYCLIAPLIANSS